MEPSITKEALSKLDIARFEGEIIVVDSPEKVDPAIDYLSKFPRLGFDTETKPSYKKGNTNSVALIQLSNYQICYLFRINYIGFPKSLITLLSDPKIKKIGLSVHDDFVSMGRRMKFSPDGFIDLQKLVPDYGIKDTSLQKIYAILFGEKISKRQRLSNWEAENFSEAQKRYAALDAEACLKIYDKLCNTQKPI